MQVLIIVVVGFLVVGFSILVRLGLIDQCLEETTTLAYELEGSSAQTPIPYPREEDTSSEKKEVTLNSFPRGNVLILTARILTQTGYITFCCFWMVGVESDLVKKNS